MSVLMWVLLGVGVVAILLIVGFFILVIIDMEKELRVERRHAKAVLEHSKVALTGKFADSYPAPKVLLMDRTSIPYADEDAFGSDDHYLLTLAALFNAKRCQSTRTVGGFFDRVKLFDPDLGPVSAADKELVWRSLVDGENIQGFEGLTNVLEFGLLDRMNYEVSQVLALSGHTSVPEDLAEFTGADTVQTYQGGIDRHETEAGALDLRTYYLVRMIHYARMGATLEWIPEREAWEHIRRIGFELRARVCRYGSWEEYGDMLVKCHTYIIPEKYISKKLARQLKFLKNEKCSPWKKLDFHHGEAQKNFAKAVPPLRLKMPKAYVAHTPFPELEEGRYCEAGARLIAAGSCVEIGNLVRSSKILSIPQAVLDDLVAGNPDHAGIHLLAGYHALETGFEARGNKTANWVSDEAFGILQERTQRACDLALRGFELAPDHHGFVDLVISAADHTARGDVYGDLTQKAFDLAGTKHLDDLGLQMQLMRPLLEKWGGSTNSSFSMAEDRMARSNNPLAGLLLIYAAVEYVGLNATCGGSDNRHKEFKLRSIVHNAATDLLALTGEDDMRRVRMWLTYWAYLAGDREMLIRIGPFDGEFSFGHIPWFYAAETNARVLLALQSDIAAVVGHKEWLRLTDFYEDQAVPEGPIQ